jgi:hypothetical protein
VVVSSFCCRGGYFAIDGTAICVLYFHVIIDSCSSVLSVFVYTCIAGRWYKHQIISVWFFDLYCISGDTHRQFVTEQNLETLKTLLMTYVCILHSLYCPENISNISQGSICYCCNKPFELSKGFETIA